MQSIKVYYYEVYSDLSYLCGHFGTREEAEEYITDQEADEEIGYYYIDEEE